MININELKGNVFKKEFNLNRCRFGYHNKNNNGGNFGLDFYLKEEFNENTDFSLHGDYNISGEIIHLSIMSIRIGCFKVTIPKEKQENLSELIIFIRRLYEYLTKQEVIQKLK